MHTILNIGLTRSKRLTNESRPVEPREALDALARVGFAIRSAEVHKSVQGGVEDTLVVYGDDAALSGSGFYDVANALDQDCIAVYWPRSLLGTLSGPMANLWGKFQAKHFLPAGVAK